MSLDVINGVGFFNWATNATSLMHSLKLSETCEKKVFSHVSDKEH